MVLLYNQIFLSDTFSVESTATPYSIELKVVWFDRPVSICSIATCTAMHAIRRLRNPLAILQLEL
jgi:hypothetical protein